MTDTVTLTRAQARKLATADAIVASAKLRLDAAQRAQAKLRSELRHLVPPATKQDEASRGVLELIFDDGGKVRIAPIAGAETFSIAEYRKAGGRITKAMEPHLGRGGGYDRWTVTGIEPLPVTPPRTRTSSSASSARRRRSDANR